MKHIKALLIKLTIITIVLFLILGVFQWVNILNILLISLLITGISYIIGNLFILPRFGIIMTSIADFGIIFLSIWFLSFFFIETAYSVLITSFFIAFLIACSEAVFYIYMLEKALNPAEKSHYESFFSKQTNRFQTEFSEESDGLDLENKNSGKQNDEEI